MIYYKQMRRSESILCRIIPEGTGPVIAALVVAPPGPTLRALHAFQFPRNALIWSSASPVATVEMTHFHQEIAAGGGGSRVFPHGSRLGRDKAAFECRNPLTMSTWGFALFF